MENGSHKGSGMGPEPNSDDPSVVVSSLVREFFEMLGDGEAGLDWSWISSSKKKWFPQWQVQFTRLQSLLCQTLKLMTLSCLKIKSFYGSTNFDEE